MKTNRLKPNHSIQLTFLFLATLLLFGACHISENKTIPMNSKQSEILSAQAANAKSVQPNQHFDASDESLALKALLKKKDDDANQKDVGSFSLFYIKVLDRHETGENLKLYSYVRERTYLLNKNRTYELLGTSGLPSLIIFEKHGVEWLLKDVKIPSDGSEYSSSIKAFCEDKPEVFEKLLAAPAAYGQAAREFLDQELERVLNDFGMSDASSLD